MLLFLLKSYKNDYPIWLVFLWGDDFLYIFSFFSLKYIRFTFPFGFYPHLIKTKKLFSTKKMRTPILNTLIIFTLLLTSTIKLQAVKVQKTRQFLLDMTGTPKEEEV